MTEIADIEELAENMAFLDDWEDRYRYVLELGRGLEPLPEEDHNGATKVEGCVSQVWLRADRKDADGTYRFLGDSDAHLVRGLVAIVLVMFNGKTGEEIAATDAMAALEKLGLNENLTPQRSNGLASMVRYIKAYGAGERAPHRVV